MNDKQCPLCEDGWIFEDNKRYECSFCHGIGVISIKKYLKYVIDHKALYQLYNPEPREQINQSSPLSIE